MSAAEYKYPFLDLKRLNAPYMSALTDAARTLVESGRYIGGSVVENFEHRLAEYCSVPYVAGVSNGLDALRLIFRAYIEMGRLHRGDEVIVPANTYIASVLAVTDNGLVPVFVEPDKNTLNLDTSLVEKHISSRTRAVMTVHLYGRVCYDAALAKAVADHNLLLIEDNAQAIGALSCLESPRGTRRTGSLGHAAAFSFYPTKNLGALGDAGAVATADAELCTTVRALANYGSDRRYHNIYEGFNCRLDPVQAAFLLCKFDGLETENEHRRRLAEVYHTLIRNPLIKKPLSAEGGECVWHQYTVLIPRRADFRAYLDAAGVQTDVHYAVPPHRQPCYSRYSSLNLPLTDKIASEIVSLPISSCTSLADASEISAIINRFAL